MIYLQRFVEESKMKIKTNQLLLFRTYTLCPDQNTINLGTQEHTVAEKFLFLKGPSFILNPPDVNWFKLKRDFDNFVNKLLSTWQLNQNVRIKK